MILTGIYVIMIEPWLLASTLLISLAAISSAYRGRKLPEQNEKLYFHMGTIYNHNAELVRNREVAYVLNSERVMKPYQKEIADYKIDKGKILGTMTMQRIFGSANTILNTCVILIIGGYGLSKGSIEISDLIVLLAAVGFLTNSLYQIPVCISDYDEPTASLDREHAEKLMNCIRISKTTVIYTTHREEEAAFADRVIRMCGG